MLKVIVPFYKNAHLAASIGKNLTSLVAELKQIEADLIFINDSPDDTDLRVQLKSETASLQAMGLKVELLENTKNIGFVESCNRGLQIAKQEKVHALLLNSDVQLASGCLIEMLKVLECDPMFGFVCPRSNNASIASLPFETRQIVRTFEEALRNFRLLSGYLPDYHLAPVAVGFCYLVRDIVLIELGIFDPKYSPGYNEENDLCFRANRVGFSCALANKAFAFHESSSSFGAEQFSLYDQRNRKLLLERYPEYDRVVGEYLQSPEFKFEQLLFKIVERNETGESWALDLTHFKTAHNGTYEFGLEVLNSLYTSERRDFSLSIIGDEAGLNFHKVSEKFPALEVYSSENAKIFDVIIKPAQIFEDSDYCLLSDKALNAFVFMLDTIAYDSAYIRGEKIKRLLQLLPEMVDGILYISDFSKDQFNRRFTNTASLCDQMACQLSVSCDDYNPISEAGNISQEFENQNRDELSHDPLPKEFFFVVGNHYHHKFLRPTIDALAKALPDLNFVGLAGESKLDGNIRLIESGSLASTSIQTLYRDSRAIIFPSLYEGFGFPIPKGLAIDSTVIARNSSLNRQIGERWNGPGKLILFETTEELLKIVEQVSRAEAIKPEQYNYEQHDGFGKISSDGKKWNWDAFAEQLIEFVKATSQGNRNYHKAKRRLEFCAHLKSWTSRVEQKEKERVVLADELHARNLAFFALQNKLKELEHKLFSLLGSKSYKIGRSIINSVATVPGMGRFRHRSQKEQSSN